MKMQRSETAAVLPKRYYGELMYRIISTSTLLLLLLLSTTKIGAEGLLPTTASTVIRSCEVAETLGAASYTYIRCKERGPDIWFAMMHSTLRIGEQITFADTPPIMNFNSKELKRTLPQLMFIREFGRSGVQPTTKSEPEPRGYANAPPHEVEPLFTGTDDNGTLVFTDDPSKIGPRMGQSDPGGISH